MQIEALTQNTPAWHEFRATHFGASEAPVALGKSKYQSRTDLMRQKHTGLSADVDAGKQVLFAKGHAAEIGGRAMAEKIIGEALSPVVVSEDIDGLPLSASLDGITFSDEIIFEHKLYSETLAQQIMTNTLDEHYTIQLDQQLLVSGAQKCLFMASDGTDAQMAYCWYGTTPKKCKALLDGWQQFSKDLAAYVPPEVIQEVIAAPIKDLPAVSIAVNGSLALISNLDVFGVELKAFIARIPEKPSTDQEFVDCKAACKALQTAQDALDAAEAHAMGQIASFDEMRRTKAVLFDLARETRLMVEKLVVAREKSVKEDIVCAAVLAFSAHVQALEEETRPIQLNITRPDFAGATKNKRTITSIKEAVNQSLVNGKIDADAVAKDIRVKTGWMAGVSVEQGNHNFLFNDLQQIIGKPMDDFKLLVTSRIDQHKLAETAKIKSIQEEAEAKARARLEEEIRAKAAAEIKAHETAHGVPQERGRGGPVGDAAAEILPLIAAVYDPTKAVTINPATIRARRPTRIEIIEAVAEHFQMSVLAADELLRTEFSMDTV